MGHAKHKTMFDQLVSQGETVMAAKHQVEGYIGDVVDQALSSTWGSRTLVALQTALGREHDRPR
jgi:hypothetical protein